MTMHGGSNGDSVAQDQLRAFVERIMRMREEAKAIKDDIREIYAEAKGNGFDKTVLGQVVSYLEKRAKDADTLAERSALFDLYLSAIDATQPHARARAREIIEEFPSAGASQVAADLSGGEGSSLSADTESLTKATTGNADNSTAEAVMSAEDRNHPEHVGTGVASRPSDGGGPVASILSITPGGEAIAHHGRVGP